MALVRDICICLRKHEFSETSQVLTLLAREHGIVRVIAKGAHRRTKAGASKFDGGIDLLDAGEAVFSYAPDRNLPPLTEWKLVDGHLDLRTNLRAVYLSQYAAELIGLLFEEHDAHPEVFDRLRDLLVDLASDRREESFLAFELDLLRDAGYMPDLGACSLCSRPLNGAGAAFSKAFFSPSRSGVVCRNCEGSAPDRSEMDPRLLRLAENLVRAPYGYGDTRRRLPRLTRHQTDPLNKMLVAHVEQTLGRRLRLSTYVLNSRPAISSAATAPAASAASSPPA